MFSAPACNASRDAPLPPQWGQSRADPFEVPLGRYDVLVVLCLDGIDEFGLRSGSARMTFLPEGSVGAPRCLKIEGGDPPPTVFVSGI
jgi:hypothetical protein